MVMLKQWLCHFEKSSLSKKMMLQLTTMDFEKRMIDLETKISFQDQTIEDLHDVIYKHQQQITQLQKAIENFQNQIKSGENDILPNEKPPHY